MIIMGSKHHFISYVSADFVLSNLDSIKFPPSPFQKSVDGANDLDLRLS